MSVFVETHRKVPNPSYQESTLQHCHLELFINDDRNVIIHRISQLIKLDVLVTIWGFNVQLLHYDAILGGETTLNVLGSFLWQTGSTNTQRSFNSSLVFASQRFLFSRITLSTIKYYPSRSTIYQHCDSFLDIFISAVQRECSATVISLLCSAATTPTVFFLGYAPSADRHCNVHLERC